jgi:hypothetical protein
MGTITPLLFPLTSLTSIFKTAWRIYQRRQYSISWRGQWLVIDWMITCVVISKWLDDQKHIKVEKWILIWNTDTVSDLCNFKKGKRNVIWNYTILIRALNFCWWEWKCNETKVAKEYCWAITQEAEQSSCGQSGSCVLEFGFQPDSLLYTNIFDHMYTQFQILQNVICTVPSGT